MALLASTSVSLAADCADDPNECTLKKLCEVATALDGGNTIWSTKSISAKHVTLAQSLGMGCRVTPIVDLCDTDPSECKVTQICEKATTESAGQKSWNAEAAAHIAMAKEYGLQCDVSAKTTTKEIITDLKLAFKAEPQLKRQQLQYALKQLGYYSYSTDGLWGKGTSAAFDKFVNAYDLQNDPGVQVFRNLLSKVSVPSSFDAPKKMVAETPKRKVDKNGLFTEYLCATNKVDFKMSGWEFLTNKGMTTATVTSPDGKQKLNSKETKEWINQTGSDLNFSIRFFKGNKVAYHDPKSKQKISEILKTQSPADKSKLKRILGKFAAPKTYTINNNVATWRKKMPKVHGVSATLNHSFNLTTNEYFLRTKMTMHNIGEGNGKLWATCDLN